MTRKIEAKSLYQVTAWQLKIFGGSLAFLLGIGLALLPLIAVAATNISSAPFEHWAWNEVIGWIDFEWSGNVNVYANRLEGYASSSVGFIALNCNSTPNGNICSGPAGNWQVQNDGNGNLSGWAWNDVIGWLSFDSATAGASPTSTYQVIINGATGDFSGWAWNDVVGWISFNCANTPGVCPPADPSSDYKVKTIWTATPLVADLTSSIFDTQATSGVALNTIMWQGTRPAGTNVKFQIASANASSGPWSYLGPDGSTATFYLPTDVGLPAPINLAQHNNKRYFRYKIILESNSAQTLSPRVDDVIINWSP